MTTMEVAIEIAKDHIFVNNDWAEEEKKEEECAVWRTIYEFLFRWEKKIKVMFTDDTHMSYISQG